MTASSSPIRRGSSPSRRPWTRLLIAALIGRALWNALFALRLLQHREHSVAALILAFARFAGVDAVLALLAAVSWVAVSPGRALWLSPAADAATRVALVALVAFGPGGADVPLTAVLYVGLLATFAVVDGALDLAAGMSLDREFGRRRGWLSLSVTGVISMATGILMFFASPGAQGLRTLLVVLSLTHGSLCALGTRHVAALQEAPRR